MQILKQGVEAEIMLGPFLDEDDGKTILSNLIIGSGDIYLSKNGGNFAAKNHASGGVEDPTVDGWYRTTVGVLDLTTVGRLLVQVHPAGALPVWVECQVVPLQVYDSLYEGSDKLETDVAQWSGTDVATPDTPGYPVTTQKTGTGQGELKITGGELDAVGQVATVTGNVEGNVVGSVASVTAPVDAAESVWDAQTTTWNNPGTMGLAQAGGVDPDAVADAVWGALAADYNDPLTMGEKQNDAGSAGDPWATELPGLYTGSQAGKIVGDNLDETVSSRSTFKASSEVVRADVEQWNGAVVPASNKPGYPISTIAEGSATGEMLLSAGKVSVTDPDKVSIGAEAATATWQRTRDLYTISHPNSMGAAQDQMAKNVWDIPSNTYAAANTYGEKMHAQRLAGEIGHEVWDHKAQDAITVDSMGILQKTMAFEVWDAHKDQHTQADSMGLLQQQSTLNPVEIAAEVWQADRDTYTVSHPNSMGAVQDRIPYEVWDADKDQHNEADSMGLLQQQSTSNPVEIAAEVWQTARSGYETPGTAVNMGQILHKVAYEIWDAQTSAHQIIGSMGEAQIAGGGGTVIYVVHPLSGTVHDGIGNHAVLYRESGEPDITISVYDRKGDPVPLAGKTLRFVARTEKTSPTGLWQIEAANITIGGTDNNEVTIHYDDTHTQDVGEFIWELWEIPGTPALDRFLTSGPLSIRQALKDTN